MWSSGTLDLDGTWCQSKTTTCLESWSLCKEVTRSPLVSVESSGPDIRLGSGGTKI